MLKKLLAVSTAMFIAIAPASAIAEEVERTSTQIGNAGQTVETVQVRQGGIFTQSNTMGGMFLCPEEGECQIVFANGSNGDSVVQQILPSVAIVQAARELRPPSYNNQEGDVNVSGVSNASSDQTQIQGQQQEQDQIASAENGDLTAINTNVTGVDVDASSNNIVGAFAQGGDGGDAFALGLGQGGNANATGGSATSGGNGGGNGNCGNGAGGGGNPNGQGNTCGD